MSAGRSVLLVLAVVAGGLASSIIDGRSERGPPQGTQLGLSDETEYVGLGDVGYAVAFADLDADRLVDILVLDYHVRKLTVLRWSHDNYTFEVSGDGFEVPEGYINGAATADFDGDGLVDVVISTSTGKGYIFVNDRNSTGTFTLHQELSPFSRNFLVLDADNDLRPDVFVPGADGERGFHVNSQDGRLSYRAWDQRDNDCAVTDPATAAFVDIDGDCLPDLVLSTACGLEIWTNPARADSSPNFYSISIDDPQYYHLLSMDLYEPSGDGQVAFADFNGDGTTDLVFMRPKHRDVIMLANLQRPRKFGSVCMADSEWRLEKHVVLEDVYFDDSRISRHFTLPPSLRVGDFNLDGLPDLIGLNYHSGRLELYENVFEKQDGAVKFEKTDYGDPLHEVSDAVAAAFFDIDDSGRQDVVIVRSRARTQLLWNNNRGRSESLFFKGTVWNRSIGPSEVRPLQAGSDRVCNVCGEISQGLSGLSYFDRPRPFAPVPGHTFAIMYDDEHGSEFRTCSQCPQSVSGEGATNTHTHTYTHTHTHTAAMEPELELRRRLDAALLRLELFSQLYTARTLAGELGCTEEEAREAMIGVVRERADAVRSFWRIGLRKATRGVVVLVENEDGEERLFCEKVRKMVYDEGWLKMYAKIFAVCSQRVRANLGDICWNFADGGP